MDRAWGPRPSLAGAAVAALVGFAAVAGTFKVRAYDLFWHLAAGRWIVDHGRVPTSDPFRFTSGGAPWVDHEWLFQVVAYGVERLVGLSGLVLVRAGAAVVLALVLLAALRRSGAPRAAAVPVVLAAVLGARPRMFLRPELVTLLALALLLAMLQAFRRASSPRVRLAWAAAIAGMVVAWANAHPGALVAPPVALAFLVGTRLPGGSGAGRAGSGEAPPSWAAVAGLPLCLATALLANPSGAAIFAVPGAIGGSLADLSGVNPEWLPLWHPAIARDSLYLFAAVAALLALVAATVRRAGWRGLDPATGLAAATVAALATTSIRHQALFYVAAAVFAGECLGRAAPDRGPGPDEVRDEGRDEGRGAAGERRLAALGVVLCLLAAAWVLVPPSRGPLAPLQGRFTSGLGLEPGRFPVHLAGAVAGDWREVGNLYQNVAWGGYLLWRLYPPRQVFLDGRNEVDPEILRRLAAARTSSRGWEALLERYDVDGALVRYDEHLLQVLEPGLGGAPVVVRRTPHAVLFPRERFALVAWDDAGMLLVRRTPARAARLALEEYRHLDPEDVRWTLARAAADPAFRRAALAEAERRLREAPPSERALRLAEALRARQGIGDSDH